LSAPRLDPAPWLAPTPEPLSWWAFAAYSLGAALLVVAAAGWLAVRGVRTAKVGELIRYS
jgi:putative ABC transport system permease protein